MRCLAIHYPFRPALAVWALLLVSAPVGAEGSVQSQATRQLLEEARSLQTRGETARAWDAWSQLIDRLRLEENPEILSEALNDASLLACTLGEYSMAVSMAGEAAEIRSRLGDKGAWARSINNTGLAYLYLGDYGAALERYRAALVLDLESEDWEGQVVRLNNMGNVLYFQGAYTEALKHYLDALDVLKLRNSESWYEHRHFVTLVNLAVLYQKLGLYQRALDISLSLRPAGLEVSRGEEAQQLSNLGVLYRRLGDPRKAMEEYSEALTLFRKESNVDGEIGVLKNMGIARATDLEDPGGAVSLFTRALEIARATSNRREEMQASLYLAEALRRTQDREVASKYFRRSLAIARDLQTTEEAWRALYGLGLIAETDGRSEVALDHFDESVALIESLRSRFQVTSLKAGFLAEKREVYDALISTLIRQEVRKSCEGAGLVECTLEPDEPTVQRLFGLFEKARFQNFQEQLGGLPKRGSDPDSNRFVDRLQELRAQMTRLWTQQIRAADSESRSQLQSRISSLETEYTALEARVSRNGDRLEPGSEPPIRSILENLPARSLVLSYWVGPTDSATLRLSPAGVKLLWRTEALGGPVSSCFRSLSTPERTNWAESCSELYRLLMGDLLEQVEAERILIVPDRELVFLPFEVLSKGPGQPLLVEEYDLFYLPSAEFSPGTETRPWGRMFPWSESLRAIGAPEIARGATAGMGFEEAWEPLPFASREILLISKQLPGRKELKTGGDALKESFLDAVRSSAPILHLATHASIDSERPEKSRILFSPVKGTETAEYLFLGEILSLSLQNKDMVVLSACETARSAAANGGGVQDFSRAFLLGGARSTVASLWRVNDQAGAEFMNGFYAALARGLGKSTALREAKLRFLHSGSNVAHPYYWAAFILYGDGFSPVPLPMFWRTALLAVLLAVLATAVAARLLRRS